MRSHKKRPLRSNRVGPREKILSTDYHNARDVSNLKGV